MGQGEREGGGLAIVPPQLPLDEHIPNPESHRNRQPGQSLEGDGDGDDDPPSVF